VDTFVLGILNRGYKVPFPNPTKYREGNNASALKNMAFVRIELAKLVESGRVLRVKEVPLCCNPLTVASKILPDGSNKQRLVIDLSRHVNPQIVETKFRMPTVQDVLDDTFKDEWMAVFDLEAAYHNIRLHPDSYCLMGFMVPTEYGEERFYVYVVLPFGLASAAFILFRMTKPVIQFLRLRGVRILSSGGATKKGILGQTVPQNGQKAPKKCQK
jgi:hypothetical protein